MTEKENSLRRKIIQNSVICHDCGDEPWSANTHDYRQCVCGAIAVDGGMDYLRRVGDGDLMRHTDTSMTMFEPHVKDMIESVEWAKENNRNNYGIALAVIRSLKKNGYLNEEAFRGWSDK